MPKIFIPPQRTICATAVYPRGNYTVSGKWNDCYNPPNNWSTTGNFQRIEVYSEKCLSPTRGCSPLSGSQATFLIFGLKDDCTWQDLHVPNTWSLIFPVFTKNFDIADSGCTRCTDDSCRVDCAIAPDGFCCIDHSVTNRLLQVLQ